MNEAETRAEHIDPALAACGWGVVEGSRIRREYAITPGRLEGLGRRGRGLTADYVLIYRNTKLAIVEAKAWAEPLTEGVGQAKTYAKNLEIRYAYATNGQGIYGIDMKTGTECEMPQYPTPDQLWGLAGIGRNTAISEALAGIGRHTAISEALAGIGKEALAERAKTGQEITAALPGNSSSLNLQVDQADRNRSHET